MATQAYIRMTEQQRDDGELLNNLDDDGIALGALPIDNPLANNLGLGTLVGMWVAPARLLNDPAYQRWVPTLGTYPIAVMDSETLHLPIVD